MSEKNQLALGAQRASVGNARSRIRKLERECEAAAALEERAQLRRDAQDFAYKLVSNPEFMVKVKQVMKATEENTFDIALEFNPNLDGHWIARLPRSHVETCLQGKKILDFSAHALWLMSSVDPKYSRPRNYAASRPLASCQCTKCFGHMNNVLSKLNDRELFQKLGFHVKVCNETAFHGVDAEDPAVEEENGLCQKIRRIILAVTSRRLRTCAVHTWYPYQVLHYPGRRPRHRHFQQHSRGLRSSSII